MSTTENKTSKYNTNTPKIRQQQQQRTVNVTHIVDAASENFIKLVNEDRKGSTTVCTSDLQSAEEYIEAVRNAIQTMTSVEKQFANSSNSSNFNNVAVSDTAGHHMFKAL